MTQELAETGCGQKASTHQVCIHPQADERILTLTRHLPTFPHLIALLSSGGWCSSTAQTWSTERDRENLDFSQQGPERRQ